MSYEIISAIGKVKDVDAHWEEVDLNNVPLATLYRRYEIIRATLKNIFTKKSGIANIDDFEYLVPNGQTFKQYIASGLGNKAIPLTPGEARISKRGLLYREALSNGFKVVPVEKGKLPDGRLDLKDNYDDLFITKEGVNPIDMQKHTLITVNGYVHQSDANSKGLWVEGGYTTIKKRKKQCIGVISFEHLGPLQQVPIKADMISKLNENVSLYRETVVDFGVDCSDKTIILVLGGFMHCLDYDVFTQISDSAIKIKWGNIPLLERIHLSTLDLTFDYNVYDTRYGETNAHVGDVYSDAFIRAYLTSPYSFIVVLDNKEVFKDITYPRQRGIPNSYIVEQVPQLPMMSHLGKFEEYVPVRDGDDIELVTADCQYLPRLYNRTGKLDEDTYRNDARRPHDRHRRAYAYFYNLITMV